SDLADNLGQENNPEWKTIAVDGSTGELVSPLGSIGYRWGEKGKWNIEAREGKDGRDVDLSLTQIDGGETAEVAFPYFGGILHEHFQHAEGESIQLRRVPVRTITLADGSTTKVATVFDLMAANLGIDRGLGGGNVASSYDDASVPGTP
ncbi:nitrate reductase subunit alpha, partial [Klebsiella pneumoniae]|nr:nitrate reductase subunit alpha [Klebsiella pneumoniae]